jgi:hypothetical protein
VSPVQQVDGAEVGREGRWGEWVEALGVPIPNKEWTVFLFCLRLFCWDRALVGEASRE